MAAGSWSLTARVGQLKTDSFISPLERGKEEEEFVESLKRGTLDINAPLLRHERVVTAVISNEIGPRL